MRPTQSDSHVNAPLTDMSVAYMQDLAEFKADELAPIHASEKQSDLFFKFTKDFWFRDGLQKVGPGAAAPRLGYGVETDSFAIDIWSAAKPISDQIRANEDSPLNSDRNAMQFLTRLERIRREKSFAAACMATGKWALDVTGNTSASSYSGDTVAQWDDSDSHPLLDVAEYCSRVKLKTGFSPNVLVLGRQAWNALRNHADIVARVSGMGSTAAPALVTRQNVAALMELDDIIVMDAVENTAADGATFAGAFIAGKHGLLMHRNLTAAIESVTAVKTFTWQRYAGAANGTRMLTYREEAIHSDIVEIESAFVHKIVASDLGVFFNGLVG